MIKKALEAVSLVAKTITLTGIAAAILWIAVLVLTPDVKEFFTKAHGHPALPPTMLSERLASHYVVMMEGYRREGLCTGTAIGPHAILSAKHCDDDGDVKSITIDLAVEKHNIVRRIEDGRDHIIWLVSGTPLRNIVSVAQKGPGNHEAVSFYGVGGGAYPPVPKYGYTMPCNDPSDADEDAGMKCFETNGIPGDSGSAIYNTSGDIVGILTYRDGDTKPESNIGFVPNFTAEQLQDAATFDGKVPAPKPAPVPRRSFGCFFVFAGCDYGLRR